MANEAREVIRKQTMKGLVTRLKKVHYFKSNKGATDVLSRNTT